MASNNMQYYNAHPSYASHPVRGRPHELPGRPGEMDDGTLSANLPLVKAYLAHVTNSVLAAEAAHAAVPANAPWHAKDEKRAWVDVGATWWKADLAGIVRDHVLPKPKPKPKKKTKTKKTMPEWWPDSDDEDYVDEEAEERERVAAGLEKSWVECMEDVVRAFPDGGDRLSVRLKKAVFVLAALSVFAFPQEHAHWAFWARNSRRTTVKLVDEIVRAVPKLITTPPSVSWIDTQLAFAEVDVYQQHFIMKVPHPSTIRPARVRKAAGTATSSSSSAKSTTSVIATTTTDVVTSTNANKRAAVVDEGRASKRRRTSGSETSPPQPRKSVRLAHKAANPQEQPEDAPVQEMSVSPAVEVVETAETEIEVDVVMEDESKEVGAAMEQQHSSTEIAIDTADVSGNLTKSAPARKRARKSAPKARRTRKATTSRSRSMKKATTIDDPFPVSPSTTAVDLASPQEQSVPSTPSSVSSPIFEVTSVSYPESTAVASPTSLGDATRVGTPFEALLPKDEEKTAELEKVSAKLEQAAVKVPARTSPRTRTQKARAATA